MELGGEGGGAGWQLGAAVTASELLFQTALSWCYLLSLLILPADEKWLALLDDGIEEI